MTYRHLQKRKNCIDKLDDILERFDSKGNGSPRNHSPVSHGHIQVVPPSLSLEFLSDFGEGEDNRALQSSKRRNRIF